MNSDSFLDGRSENAIHLLVQNLRAESKRLGFSRLGIAAVEPPLRQDVFRDWLDQGFAGVMEQWLRRHEKLRADPSTLLKDARSVIVLATDYSTVPPERCQAEQGRVSRYAWGDDYHDLLRRRVNSLGTWLKAAAPKCLTVGVVDSAPLAEREFGWAAGLGWFGKNTMLIDPDAGSFFFLSALLTDLILPVDAPLTTDHCGTCTACLDACPTGAFVAPRVLDANKCISALTIEDHGPLPVSLRLAMGNWVFGCDICQDVCPWNRRAPVSNEPAFVPRETVTTLSLLDLLSLDEAAFRSRFKGSPLLRAKRQGLLRSAAIAMGNLANTGHSLDAVAIGVLLTSLGDSAAVVRGAIAWALGQWRRADGSVAPRAESALRAQLLTETDAGVLSEIKQALRDDNLPGPNGFAAEASGLE